MDMQRHILYWYRLAELLRATWVSNVGQKANFGHSAELYKMVTKLFKTSDFMQDKNLLLFETYEF